MPRKKPGNQGNGREKLSIQHSGFAPYLHRYLEDRRINHYSEDSLQRYDSNLRQFIVWCDERALNHPTEVSKPILDRYKKHLYYQRKTNGNPLSITSQRIKLASLKAWFKWLVQENYLPTNPASEIALPRVPQRLPRHILDHDEIGSLMNSVELNKAQGLRDRAVMELLYSCGLRRKECAQLILSDLDLNRATVFVREGKGHKDRLLPVGELACQWLEKYLMDARSELLLHWDSTDALFIDDYGEGYNADRLGRIIKKYLNKAEIRVEGGAHLLRHAMATHMLENGADIRFIQAMLGHSDLRATQIYTRVSVEKLREIHKATHPAKCGAAKQEKY
ncbi:MAG: site-specific tyrosine recombinase XerC [Spongiibacteraceae bacterium]|nr:site-specific tyrosine recombinase XerC [Spongiibacteraceae bacterium]